jgi:hypothetical protein
MIQRRSRTKESLPSRRGRSLAVYRAVLRRLLTPAVSPQQVLPLEANMADLEVKTSTSSATTTRISSALEEPMTRTRDPKPPKLSPLRAQRRRRRRKSRRRTRATMMTLAAVSTLTQTAMILTSRERKQRDRRGLRKRQRKRRRKESRRKRKMVKMLLLLLILVNRLLHRLHRVAASPWLQKLLEPSRPHSSQLLNLNQPSSPHSLLLHSKQRKMAFSTSLEGHLQRSSRKCSSQTPALAS